MNGSPWSELKLKLLLRKWIHTRSFLRQLWGINYFNMRTGLANLYKSQTYVYIIIIIIIIITITMKT